MIFCGLFLCVLVYLPYKTYTMSKEREEARTREIQRLNANIAKKNESLVGEHRLGIWMSESQARKSVGNPHKEIEIYENGKLITLWVQTAAADSPVVVFFDDGFQNRIGEIQPTGHKSFRARMADRKNRKMTAQELSEMAELKKLLDEAGK